MRDVAIIGVGQVPVGEHWDRSLRVLAHEAIQAAMKDAIINHIDAMYVGNAFGATFSSQSHLGALIADYAGLSGIEAYAVDAGDASGGAALRTGYLAVASGAVNVALVVGVEKSTDKVGAARMEARNVGIDADYESVHGATITSLAALLMQRYMYEFQVDVKAFEGFSLNAHANGYHNHHAMFRNKLREGVFAKAPAISSPVNLFDGAPDGDGAAAVILAAADSVPSLSSPMIQITGSALSTDTMSLQDRADILNFSAVSRSSKSALHQAGMQVDDIHIYELHDAYTIMTTLSLEALGLAERGVGWQLSVGDTPAISLQGRIPISTFGGLKSRGNPVGATGVYQAVEAVLQLRGVAEANQVNGAKHALIQNLGGIASTVVTHVLSRV